jgi:hypothetical protein
MNETAPQTVKDEEAIALYGVGPSGSGRRWVRHEGQLSLLDLNIGSVVYRKSIDQEDPSPLFAPRTESKPLPDMDRPSTPMKELGDDAGGADLSSPKLDFPDPIEPSSLPFEIFRGSRPDSMEEPMERRPVVFEDEEVDMEPPVQARSTTIPDFPEDFPEDLPESMEDRTIFTPQELSVPDRIPSIQAKSDSIRAMIDSTTQDIGEPVSAPDSSIVTPQAIEEQSTPGSKHRLVIDPNTNRAWIESDGRTVEEFSVGTGDITGDRYGKKYYSPTGKFKVKDEVPYKDVEGSYGPLWMGLDAPKSPGGAGYGLHGPHERASVEGGGFINEGYVSHGCFRFREQDIVKIGDILDVGAEVEIIPYQFMR